MPRQPRLEAPDALPHVMVRGQEHRGIVRDDPDRTACVARLAALAEGGAGTVYAWAVLPGIRDSATFLTLHEVEPVVQKTSEPRRVAGLGPSPRGTAEG